jgi:hypothetical protein
VTRLAAGRESLDDEYAAAAAARAWVGEHSARPDRVQPPAVTAGCARFKSSRARARGTGKCRHGEKWNNQSVRAVCFMAPSLVWDARRPRPRQDARMVLSSLKKLAALVTKRPRYGRLIARAYIRAQAALPSFVDDLIEYRKGAAVAG